MATHAPLRLTLSAKRTLRLAAINVQALSTGNVPQYYRDNHEHPQEYRARAMACYSHYTTLGFTHIDIIALADAAGVGL